MSNNLNPLLGLEKPGNSAGPNLGGGSPSIFGSIKKTAPASILDVPLGETGEGPLGPTISDSIYRVVFPEGMNVTAEMAALQRKRVEDMTQEELRQIYLNIKGKPGLHVFSASDLNHAAKTGRLPEPRDHEETDSLYIGDQVHKAMELNGANLVKLKCVDDIGVAPEEPSGKTAGFEGFTKSDIDIVRVITLGGSAMEAVKQARNNATTKAVTVEQIKKFMTTTTEGEREEAFTPTELKALIKMVKETEKLCAKIKQEHLIAYKQYLKNVELHNSKKLRHVKPGDTLLDDLTFRKMGAVRMRDTINGAYNALRNDSVVMDIYNQGVGSHGGEILTEYVVLWKHEIDGKVVECKSMFDRYVINPELKKATVSDIKTHSGYASQFTSQNYLNYGYFRSMSFYNDAVKYDLKLRGYNPEEWDIQMVLLPVSTYYGHDVGCLFPTANISKIDIMSGKQNGMLKPHGFSRFSPTGEVQAFLDGGLYNKCAELGMIHSNAKEYIREGWETIMKKLTSAGPSI